MHDSDRTPTHLHLIRHLTGPLQAGAVSTRLEVGADGRVPVPRAREALLLVAPARDLVRERWRLRAEHAPDAAAAFAALPEVVFEPYSEAGACLPLHRPTVAADGFTAASEVRLRLTRAAVGGGEEEIAAVDLAAALEVHLLEGVLGRVLVLLTSEKTRLRRQLRELAAVRLLTHAHRDALDRLGADLGVPRFGEALEPRTGPPAEILSRNEREGDDAFRARLALYRPWLLPSRAGLLERLNGPGSDADPNRGLPARVGVRARFTLREEDNPFALAVHVLASSEAAREAFFDELRAHHLIVPENTPPANVAHAARRLPSERKERVQELRRQLREGFELPPGAALAPPLALALARAARCRAALGEAAPWRVRRAQDATAGSRYQLGLGADLAPPSAAQWRRLAAAAGDPDRAAAGDPEIEALLRSLQPRPPEDDPEGSWLLEPCGMRTVHRVNTQRLYLSSLPSFGLTLEGPGVTPVGAEVAFDARYHAPGDPGGHALLLEALRTALAAWSADGHEAWEVLDDAEARARWRDARADPAAASLLDAAGWPPVGDPAPVVDRLETMAPELLATLRLPPALATRVLGGDTDAIAALGHLRTTLTEAGVPAALPLTTAGGELLVVAGVTGLPRAGFNLSERRAAGFHWFSVPIGQPARARGRLQPRGGHASLTLTAGGVEAVVVLGYARRGLTDPYEVRVELPEGTRLSFEQYEYVMNLLAHAHPLGVEVNTFALRRRHVDLDGDGTAEPLEPGVARAFRPFRRKRHRGEPGAAQR